MNDNDRYVIRAGQSAHGQFATDVDPPRAGWEWSSIRVVELPPGGEQTITASETEFLVLPLEGGCTVRIGDQEHCLQGRPGVFVDITDYLYVPRRTEALIRTERGGRFALPGARATADLPVRYCPRDEVVTTLRGAGNCSRQVNNYALGNTVQTSHLLACEVLTPGGNWSSYPPHKHDENTENERILEEIYYYEIRPGAQGSSGMALQRIYHSPATSIDVCAEVRTGDVVVMPGGYHGPSAAAPGHDLYYLNVMAGPSEDATWLMTDDPDHGWIRQTWDGQQVDARLPMTPTNP